MASALVNNLARMGMARGRFSKRLYRVGLNWRIEHVTLDLNTPFDLL